MYGLILKFIYIIFAAFFFVALFICMRDLVRGLNRSMLLTSIIGLALIIFVFLLDTSALPAVILPLVVMISVPIYITDKNRNWDSVDKVFRYISFATIIGAIFLAVNWYGR